MGEEKQQEINRRRKVAALRMFAVIVVVGIIVVAIYLHYKKTRIATDDAYIDGNVHVIASKVPGTVRSILVKSNQYVKAGDLLVEMDPTDYEVRVSEAQAALNVEKAKLAEIDAKTEAAKKQLEETISKADAVAAVNELQRVNLDQAEKDKERAENLLKKDAISKERCEKAITAYKAAVAQVKAAAEGLKSFSSTIETQKAMIKQSEATKTTQLSAIRQKEAVLEGAKLNYGYAQLIAPVDGYVTKKSVEIGNQVQPGQPLMAVVSLDDISIVANYKETQLEKVRPGQKVEIKVDTYPGKKFKGRVESIMSGTGAAFSLFPPENATGNFVKVVQRIPVKIVLDKDTNKEHILRLGMSVEPTIIIE